MKNISYLKLSLMSLFALGTLASCVRDDKYDIPEITCTNQFDEPNATIAQVKALAPTPVNYVSNYVITEDLIFDGYVVSTDENGNFYKTISIQDSPTNPTAGIQIAINKSYLYADYPKGAHIRVKAKGLSVGNDRGVVKLGLGTPTGQLQASQMSQYISGVCNGNGMDVQTIVPVELNSLAEANQAKYHNILVTVNGVQFDAADGTLTYGDTVNKLTVDRTISDKAGSTMVIRNSGYAAFAGEVLPTGSGSITMVMSQYTSGSTVTWQGYLNSSADVHLNDARFVLGILGGESLSYNTTLTENFENLTTQGSYAQIADAKYLNYAQKGKRYWESKTFGGNKYMQISAYKASPAAVDAFFIVPVSFTGSSKLSFKTKDGYNTGNPLKVYYSTKYIAGSELKKADLVDITSQFTISTGSTSSYASAWVESGEYTIPATGKGFIFFEYEGDASGITTTMQIDDIKVQ